MSAAMPLAIPPLSKRRPGGRVTVPSTSRPTPRPRATGARAAAGRRCGARISAALRHAGSCPQSDSRYPARSRASMQVASTSPRSARARALRRRSGIAPCRARPAASCLRDRLSARELALGVEAGQSAVDLAELRSSAQAASSGAAHPGLRGTPTRMRTREPNSSKERTTSSAAAAGLMRSSSAPAPGAGAGWVTGALGRAAGRHDCRPVVRVPLSVDVNAAPGDGQPASGPTRRDRCPPPFARIRTAMRIAKAATLARIERRSGDA